MSEPYAARTHDKMREVLMDPDAPGPAVHYHMVRGGPLKSNITIWEPGQVGGEYIKAYGHYHVDDLPETYRILQGEGILLTQLRSGSDGEISEFKAFKVKAGDVVDIPLRSGHTLVNTGKTWLVTSDDSPWSPEDSASMPQHADYEPMKKLRGMAYYVVEKDGAPALVRNPNYSSAPTAAIEVAESPSNG
ncbi:MAG: hypothetical protein KGI45_01670 [Patescibacteria group bacterium]|nr:hypothetical protein [Patescibacteria group bacterium]MDE1966765.1 hypothetical protein [Patescibacteria group bacterium]